MEYKYYRGGLHTEIVCDLVSQGSRALPPSLLGTNIKTPDNSIISSAQNLYSIENGPIVYHLLG